MRTGKRPQRRGRRIIRALTDDERARLDAIRGEIEIEKPEIKARARRLFARHDRLRAALANLKATRESLGLSLQEVADLAAIGKAHVACLERARDMDPKIDTLARYAEVLGQNLVLTLEPC